MMTAQSSGMWNIRLRATALPSTSARSQAPMATSHNSQLGQRVHLGYQSRQHWARSLPGHHAQAGGDDLHEDGHQAGQPDHPQEPVLELSAALQVRPPVAGVHVADADQNRRPDEGPPLLPEARLMVRHSDRTVHPLQRHVTEVEGCWFHLLLYLAGARGAWGFVFKIYLTGNRRRLVVATDYHVPKLKYSDPSLHLAASLTSDVLRPYSFFSLRDPSDESKAAVAKSCP